MPLPDVATDDRRYDYPPLPHFMLGMSCGCHGFLRCDRHETMVREIARRHLPTTLPRKPDDSAPPASD